MCCAISFSAKQHMLPAKNIKCTDFFGGYNIQNIMHEVAVKLAKPLMYLQYIQCQKIQISTPAQTCRGTALEIKLSSPLWFAWYSSYQVCSRLDPSMCVSIGSLWRQSGCHYWGSVVTGRDLPLWKQTMKKRRCQEPADTDTVIDAVPLPLHITHTHAHSPYFEHSPHITKSIQNTNKAQQTHKPMNPLRFFNCPCWCITGSHFSLFYLHKYQETHLQTHT